MYKGEKIMPIKTFKSEVLGRTCISTIIELPVHKEYIFVPNKGDIITQVSFSGVQGHDDLITVAMIIAKEDTPSIDAKADA